MANKKAEVNELNKKFNNLTGSLSVVLQKFNQLLDEQAAAKKERVEIMTDIEGLKMEINDLKLKVFS